MTLWCHTDHNDDFLTCGRLAMCMNVDPLQPQLGQHFVRSGGGMRGFQKVFSIMEMS